MRAFRFALFHQSLLRHGLTAAVFAAMLGVAPVMALSPEIEVDRLLLAAQERIEQQDFTGALGFLERVSPLKVTPPVQYYYLEGKARFETGAADAARPLLERYVEKAGRDGPYYQQSLQLLTRIEQQAQAAAQQQQKDVAAQAASSTPVAAASGEERRGDAYDSKVQSLYLGLPLSEALVTHVNGLLRTYAYLEGKIKNVERGDGLRYSVSVRGRGELMVTETRRIKTPGGAAQNQINVLPLNTFGVSPFVEYRCSKAADSCYIKNPSDGDDWIKIAYDEAGARELATALERLIKALQRG